MATLTEASILSKRTFRITVITIASVLVIFLVFTLAKKIKENFVLPPPIPATVAFGKLPVPNLTEGVTPPAGIKYSTETVTGDLPRLPTMAKVFVIDQGRLIFGGLEKAKSTVIRVGFSNQPVSVTPTVATFVDPNNEYRRLTIDLISGNFSLESDYLTDEEIASSNPRHPENAQSLAISFMGNFGLDTEEYPREKAAIIKYKIENGSLEETPALLDTNLFGVNFIRSDLDDLPIILSNTDIPKSWALVSENKVVAAIYHPQAIQKHRFATYPLKGIKKAFNDLKNGKAAYNKPFWGETFSIREVFLGYVETEKFQGFLQPVYLFRGDAGLMAYVPAIDEKWINSQ